MSPAELATLSTTALNRKVEQWKVNPNRWDTRLMEEYELTLLELHNRRISART